MLKKHLLILPFLTFFSLHAASPFDDPFFNDPFGDDIFKEMMQMQKEMDKMFERMQQRMDQRSSGLVNPLGTYKMAVQNQIVDKGDHYELLTSIPESKENHIDIKTASGMMHITAKIVEEREEKSQYGVSQSRDVRMYQQSTALPQNADESAIKTIYRDGKLVITIGKQQGSMKTIAVPKTLPSTNQSVETTILQKEQEGKHEHNQSRKIINNDSVS